MPTAILPHQHPAYSRHRLIQADVCSEISDGLMFARRAMPTALALPGRRGPSGPYPARWICRTSPPRFPCAQIAWEHFRAFYKQHIQGHEELAVVAALPETEYSPELRQNLVTLASLVEHIVRPGDRSRQPSA